MSIKTRIHGDEDLGKLLRGLRLERRLTQSELAEIADVARSAVQKLERGAGTVNLSTATRILTALSLDLAVVDREGMAGKLFDESE